VAVPKVASARAVGDASPLLASDWALGALKHRGHGMGIATNPKVFRVLLGVVSAQVVV